MATRAKMIRNFAKKFFNIDVSGMSETAALKDLLKKKYNVDASGGSVTSVLGDVIENNESIDDGGSFDYRTFYVSAETSSVSASAITINGCVNVDTMASKGVSVIPNDPDGESAAITLKGSHACIVFITSADYSLSFKYLNSSNEWVYFPDTALVEFEHGTVRCYVARQMPNRDPWKDGTHIKIYQDSAGQGGK